MLRRVDHEKLHARTTVWRSSISEAKNEKIPRGSIQNAGMLYFQGMPQDYRGFLSMLVGARTASCCLTLCDSLGNIQQVQADPCQQLPKHCWRLSPSSWGIFSGAITGMEYSWSSLTGSCILVTSARSLSTLDQ